MSNVTLEDAQVARTEAAQPATTPKKKAKAAQARKPAKGPHRGKKAAAKTARKAATKPAAAQTNKKAQVMALMRRPKGATLAEIIAATGWQKHTVRGFVSILGKKGGAKIESSKNSSGERAYKIAK